MSCQITSLMPYVNLIVNAVAGAGKTQRIVSESLASPEKKTLIVTYTNNNEAEIKSRFICENGCIPSHVRIQTWFSFLLEHFVRPYQRSVLDMARVRGLAFVQGRSGQRIPERRIKAHYFSSELDIYSDKIAKFGVRCEERSGGAVTGRLAQIFDHIYIDEVQDLVAWDLDVLELLLGASLNVTLVGDCRQATYSTNNAAKYPRFAGSRIIDLFREWHGQGWCEVEDMYHSYRSIQTICDLADYVFPMGIRTVSENADRTGHDGVFCVSRNDVPAYVERVQPQALRYSRVTDAGGLVFAT